MMKKTKSPLRRKSEEKVNFATVFSKLCTANFTKLIPVVHILSAAPKNGHEWKIYQHSISKNEHNFDVYIQNENFEKEALLEKVIIKNIAMDYIIMYALRETIKVFNSVTALRLTDCNLSNKEIDILHTIVNTNETLTDLCIDGNPNNKQNFYIFLQYSNLKFLSMQRCKINDRGIKLICNELGQATSQTLISIDLSSNMISDTGVSDIANALRVNRTLISLVLADNWITDKGAVNLLNIFQAFPLTQDEVQTRREFNYEYEFKTYELTEQFKSEIKKIESLAISTSLMQQKKYSLKKEKSNSTASTRRSGRISKTSYNDKLEQYLEINRQKVDHPFITQSNPENGSIICLGNFIVTYVNLAYNKLSPLVMTNILEVLRYQLNSTEKIQDSGLLNIILNGNPIIESPLMDELKCLLKEKVLNSMCRVLPRKASSRRASAILK